MKVDTVHTIYNSNGLSVKILNFGGIIHEINTPDKYNNFKNIVLNYKDINEYYNDSYFMGAAIGRYANRIKNGTFKLNDETYFLEKNDNENHLHGGSNGFHKVNWDLKRKSKKSIHLTKLCNEKTDPKLWVGCLQNGRRKWVRQSQRRVMLPSLRRKSCHVACSIALVSASS